MHYRKKPIVIEAFKVPAADGGPTGAVPVWALEAVMAGKLFPRDGGGIDVPTPEGVMRANVGDYIIKGVKGELYPCKPDIFEATYDAVDASEVR